MNRQLESASVKNSFSRHDAPAHVAQISLGKPMKCYLENRSSEPRLEICPGEVAKRQAAVWRGISGEVVQVPSGQSFEASFEAPFHLLIAYQRAGRHDGESVVQGLPRSKLRDFSQKLTFVPAGHSFRECQVPTIATRATFLFIDPTGPLLGADVGFMQAIFKPRLFFENPILFETVCKLGVLIEGGESGNRLYAEALSVVLVHELIRLDVLAIQNNRPARGGLAGWQKKKVDDYIRDNLSNQISLATLAGLAQLSPYHFSRAFKQTFGMPPLRYHGQCRIEYAKTRLLEASKSITDIAIEVGFSDASSFARVFRKLAGRTPSGYRRGII